MRLSEDQIKEIIRKIGKKKWAIYSKKKKKGRRKRLGTFNSRKAANKRERQIQYFKNMGESVRITRQQLRSLIMETTKSFNTFPPFDHEADTIDLPVEDVIKSKSEPEIIVPGSEQEYIDNINIVGKRQMEQPAFDMELYELRKKHMNEFVDDLYADVTLYQKKHKGQVITNKMRGGGTKWMIGLPEAAAKLKSRNLSLKYRSKIKEVNASALDADKKRKITSMLNDMSNTIQFLYDKAFIVYDDASGQAFINPIVFVDNAVTYLNIILDMRPQQDPRQRYEGFQVPDTQYDLLSRLKSISNLHVGEDTFLSKILKKRGLRENIFRKKFKNYSQARIIRILKN